MYIFPLFNPFEYAIFPTTAMLLLCGRVVRPDPHAGALPHLFRPLHILVLEDRLHKRRSCASEVIHDKITRRLVMTHGNHHDLEQIA